MLRINADLVVSNSIQNSSKGWNYDVLKITIQK